MQTALRQKKKILASRLADLTALQVSLSHLPLPLLYPLYLYYVVLIATSGAADKDCHID